MAGNGDTGVDEGTDRACAVSYVGPSSVGLVTAATDPAAGDEGAVRGAGSGQGRLTLLGGAG